MRLLFALLAPLIHLVLMAPHSQAAEGEAPTAETLQAIAEQRSLSAIKIAYVLTQSTEGKPADEKQRKTVKGIIPKIEQRVLIDLKSDRVFKDEQITNNRAERDKPVRMLVAWDLESYMQYYPDQGYGIIQSKPRYSDVNDKTDPFLFACLLCSPGPRSDGITDASLASWLRGGEVHKELDEIDGRRCYVVDRRRVNDTLLARAWLDVERSLAPVKFQHFEFDRPEVLFECHSMDVAGGGRTVWLPLRIDVALYQKGGITIKKSVSIERNAIRINPKISDDLFQIDFPAGTLVQDEVLNKRYVVDGAPR